MLKFWRLESRSRISSLESQDFWWSLGLDVLTISRSRKLRSWLHHCLHHKENAPWKQALHSHIFRNRFQVELYMSLPQWCTFCHPLQLWINWRRNVVITVNSTQLSLKWTWTINNYVGGSLIWSVLVEQNPLLKSFVQIVFCSSAIRNAFFYKVPNIYFASTFYK